jgi:hypothetical protein
VRVVPVNELAIVPDLVGLLNCHADSLMGAAFPIIISEPKRLPTSGSRLPVLSS